MGVVLAFGLAVWGVKILGQSQDQLLVYASSLAPEGMLRTLAEGTIRGVICHHTAGPLAGNAPSLGIVTNGRPDLSGPLAQLCLGRDGTFFLVATIGFVALGLVLGVIAWFLLKAAVDFNAGKVVSLGGAMTRLARADYGNWVLGATAGGLLAYGLFGLLQARYHKV